MSIAAYIVAIVSMCSSSGGGSNSNSSMGSDRGSIGSWASDSCDIRIVVIVVLAESNCSVLRIKSRMFSFSNTQGERKGEQVLNRRKLPSRVEAFAYMPAKIHRNLTFHRNQIKMDVYRRQKNLLLKGNLPRTTGPEYVVYDSTALRKVFPKLFLARIFDDILKKSDKSVETFTFTIEDVKLMINLSNLITGTDIGKSVSQTDDLPAYIKRIRSIHVPLASLQLPLFTKDEHMVRNFAGLGFLIGCEIFRDFEIAGNNFSMDLWLSEQSYRRYQKLKNDFINKFTQRQNQSQTTSVNDIIADEFGFKVASKAFLLWNSENIIVDENLPALKMKHLKTFYSVFARIFCSSEESNPQNYADSKRIFAPNTERVHKILQNSEWFAKAFQCPEGASMNPQPKVEL
ncbi:membrane metallo-endopeptidase-like 1 [Octopus vulgaris]|uniref:Membrane metallo-endopeptidase-like 1 n=1 Tax=Octopus vulgaris TaxID=6645 RepID=A0AA36B3G7_OCTVU|nr:membrane metallo-endopeptidase-like 1 [Octopus vulgaris]